MSGTCSDAVAIAIAALFKKMGWRWGSPDEAHFPTKSEIQAEFTELLETVIHGEEWANCGRLMVTNDPDWGIMLYVEVGQFPKGER